MKKKNTAICPYEDCGYTWVPRLAATDVKSCPDCHKRFAGHTRSGNCLPIIEQEAI